MEELGVANDNENINILPFEMLSEIMSFLQKPRVQMNREVCKKWKDSFDVFNEIHLEVTNLKWPHLKNCNHPCMSVKLQSFTILPDLQDPPTMNFLNNTRVLEFTDWFVSYNLAFILTHCMNLECLSFQGCLMDSPSDPTHILQFNVENVLPPKLKTLKYVPRLMSRYDQMELHSRGIDSNGDHLFLLLKQVLVNMELVYFELGNNGSGNYQFYDELISGLLTQPNDNGIVDPFFNDQNAKTIYDFLQDNKNTIKSITLCRVFKAVISTTNTNENGDWPPQFEELQFRDRGSDSEDAIHNLIRQKHLKRITVCSYEITWALISRMIGRIGNELTEITLECFNFSSSENFDAHVFQTCTCLRKLSIGQARVYCSRYCGGIINCDLLPPSLRILKIVTTLIYSSDQNFGDVSFQNLKKLERLELYNRRIFQLDNTSIYTHEIDEDILDHLLKSLSSLTTLKLQLYKRRVPEVQTCTACGHKKNVETVLPSIPADFVRHVETTPGLRFSLDHRTELASISILPAF